MIGLPAGTRVWLVAGITDMVVDNKPLEELLAEL